MPQTLVYISGKTLLPTLQQLHAYYSNVFIDMCLLKGIFTHVPVNPYNPFHLVSLLLIAVIDPYSPFKFIIFKLFL